MAVPDSFNSMVSESAIAFLKAIPPFQFLAADALRNLVRSMSIEYFPRGTLILSAGSKAAEAMFVIQKGGVKLALQTSEGSEVVLDMRSEGEMFGLLSTMTRDAARLDVTAVEDTLCYSLPGEEVQKLISEHADVASYLLSTSVTRYIDRSLNEIRERSNRMADAERLLYTLTVADVTQRKAIVCARNETVQQAARQMAEAHATSVFVLDEEGRAEGVVTDNDLTRKVVAQGLALDSPVTAIMSRPVIALERTEHVFHALLEMLGHNIHHLLVTNQGKPESVITNHDLLRLQGKSPISLMRHIDQQETLDELAQAQANTGEIVALLMREGARAGHITRVIAEINDRVLAKIVQLAEKQLGAPPVPYCWVALGSEGRREQTFKTDQDNALIHADTSDEHRTEVERYFAEFSEFAASALARCGYPRCEGGYMASNRRWRQPLSAWKRQFRAWITDADQRSAQDALISFDMRPVAGDPSLCVQLWEYNRELLKTANLFKSIFAWVSLDHKPPMGFFRSRVVLRNGELRNRLDLKLQGTGPIVNAVRMFALDAGIPQTNTFERITALQKAAYADPGLLNELREALELLTLLRLECQLQQSKDGQPVSNFIEPGAINQLHRALLKQAFRSVEHAQSLVKSNFETWVWARLN